MLVAIVEPLVVFSHTVEIMPVLCLTKTRTYRKVQKLDCVSRIQTLDEPVLFIIDG